MGSRRRSRKSSARRIWILNGHPGKESLSRALAASYAESARDAGHEVRVTQLSELSFDADFGHASYRDAKPLEPSLERVLEDLVWCEHLVLTTPMWWGGLPGKLKGLFDRVLLPGTAFDPRRTRFGLPAPLLRGRTARVFVTSDTPSWWMRLAYRSALFRQLERQVFGYVGIRPTRITHFSKASRSSAEQASRWIDRVASLGENAA